MTDLKTHLFPLYTVKFTAAKYADAACLKYVLVNQAKQIEVNKKKKDLINTLAAINKQTKRYTKLQEILNANKHNHTKHNEMFNSVWKWFYLLIMFFFNFSCVPLFAKRVDQAHSN